MCKCTPEIRTPYCGKPGCEWPGRETELITIPSLRVQRDGPLARILSAVTTGVKSGSLVDGGVTTLQELSDQVVVFDLDHRFQDFPVKSGLTVTQMVACLELLILQLRGPDGRCPTRELSLAVTELESGINWLKRNNELRDR